jgi:protein-L-isoaspartate(D-aspartate) O-methyltransferase
MSDVAAVRRHFAQAIRRRERITSIRLVQALAAVPRERFLSEGPWRIRGSSPHYWSTLDANPIYLYDDVRVAIDEDRSLDNGLPSLWARVFDSLDVKKKERVVQVGCGLGYYSAILSEMVGPQGTVIAIDCDAAFVRQARRNLGEYGNVEVIHGDGCREVGGPADVIIAHAGCAAPHSLWLDSLRPGGRLSIPLTNEDRQGTLFKITRRQSGYRAEALGPIEIFPCDGRGSAPFDERLIRWWEASRVRSLRRDAHARDRACWSHQEGFCFSIR